MNNPTGTMGAVLDKHALAASYLSIDPGEKESTGVTLWNSEGLPLHYNELDELNFNLLLDMLSLSEILRQVIIEEFRLYQNKAIQQSGSKLKTVQIIGMTKRFNHCLDLPPVVEVRADSKEVAALWSGMRTPKGHMPNWMASYLIGYWWLHSVAKIIPARVLEQA